MDTSPISNMHYYSKIFLDVSQTFDKLRHQSLSHQMAKLLHNNHQLIILHLSERTFRLAKDKARSLPSNLGLPVSYRKLSLDHAYIYCTLLIV